jgi:periplasmic divalent cation tolerance protein
LRLSPATRHGKTGALKEASPVTEIVTVEINCPDAGTAAAIAEALVARGLAAAANIHPAVESLYRWQGRIERATEVPLVLKTRAALFPALAAAARAMHPYETPSILARPVAAATDDYRAWVAAETSGSATP